MKLRSSLVSRFALVVGLVLFLGLTIASPIILERVASFIAFDAARSSGIGESYGAVSAILSAFALGALAASIVVQVRQTRTTQLFNARTVQLELVRFLLVEDNLAAVFVGNAEDTDLELFRRNIFRNLWYMYNHMLFVSGTHDEETVRRNFADEYFSTVEGTDHWKTTAPAYAASLRSRKDREFIQIVNDEHATATTKHENSVEQRRHLPTVPGYL